jgi:anti-sigma factor RsiW
MRHQPYENWILEIEKPDPTQRQELQAHLAECHTCARFADAHNQVERVLNRAVTTHALAGFTVRWKASLVERKREQERKQAQAMLISLSSIAVGLFLAAAVLLLPEISFISLAANALSTSVNVLNGVANFWSTISRLAQVVPPGIIILTSIFISSWILLACTVWGLSIWKLAFQRGKTK